MDSSSGLCQLDNVIISDKLQLSNGSVITTGNCVAGALIFTTYKSNKKLIVSEYSELTIEGNIEQLSGGSYRSGYLSELIVDGTLNVSGDYNGSSEYSCLYLQEETSRMNVKGDFTLNCRGNYTDGIITIGANYKSTKVFDGTILKIINKDNLISNPDTQERELRKAGIYKAFRGLRVTLTTN